jgi:hypothetical protein
VPYATGILTSCHHPDRTEYILEVWVCSETVNFATADATGAFSNKTEPVFTGEWMVK